MGLLNVGSESAPKKELIGEAGTKELAVVKEEGETGLAAYFVKSGKEGTMAVLGENGLPPLPSGLGRKQGADKYLLTEESAYPSQ